MLLRYHLETNLNEGGLIKCSPYYQKLEIYKSTQFSFIEIYNYIQVLTQDTDVSGR